MYNEFQRWLQVRDAFNKQDCGQHQASKVCGYRRLTVQIIASQLDRKKESTWIIITENLDMSET